MKFRPACWCGLVPVLLLLGGCEAVRQNQTAQNAARAILTARAYDDVGRAARGLDVDDMRRSIERYTEIAPGGGDVTQYARMLNEEGYPLANEGSTLDDFQRAETLTRLAVKLYDGAIRKNPGKELRSERATTRDSLAWALFRLGRLDEAEREQREAIREARETHALSAELPLHLGDILVKTGKKEQARAAYREALTLRQVEPDAHQRARAALMQLKTSRRH